MSAREMTPAMLAYCLTLAVCLGAVLGSFLHCAAWRIARHEDFIRGRSRCPHCSHPLAPADLVPVLSWLFLRGRCRYCGEKIPARYALAELFFAALTAACFLRFGLTVACARDLVFLACLFCLSLVDLEVMEIPDGCLLAAALAWLAALPFLWTGWGDALRCVLAGLAFGGGVLLLSLALDKLLGRESLGGGDVKLLAVVGLYLGFAGTLFALLLACVLGLAGAALTRRRRGEAFPFGPAVSAAAAVMLLWGGGLVNWYLSLL